MIAQQKHVWCVDFSSYSIISMLWISKFHYFWKNESNSEHMASAIRAYSEFATPLVAHVHFSTYRANALAKLQTQFQPTFFRLKILRCLRKFESKTNCSSVLLALSAGTLYRRWWTSRHWNDWLTGEINKSYIFCSAIIKVTISL